MSIQPERFKQEIIDIIEKKIRGWENLKETGQLSFIIDFRKGGIASFEMWAKNKLVSGCSPQ